MALGVPSSRRWLSSRVLPASKLFTSRPDEPVRLRMGPTRQEGLPPRTVQASLVAAAAAHPDVVAMAVRRANGGAGAWEEWTYEQYLHDARTAAAGMRALGLARFRGVGILGHNSPEWFLSYLGAVFAGGLTVGIYATSSPAAVAHVCAHAPVEVLAVPDAAELERVTAGRSVEEALPSVKAVVLTEPGATVTRQMAAATWGKKAMTWKDLMSLGESTGLDEIRKLEEEQAANQACSLVYTSGTTGIPKGLF